MECIFLHYAQLRSMQTLSEVPSMLKRLVVLCTFLAGTFAAAHATSLTPGSSVSGSTLTYGSDQVGYFNGTITNGVTANYAVAVYVDPSNVYCAGCLDFVYTLDVIDGSKGGALTDLAVQDFGGSLTDVGFSGSGTNPSSISRSADGSVIDFIFSGLDVGFASSDLVIETNDTAFTFGSLAITDTVDGASGSYKSLDPVPTPEPASILLLGTGLIGLAAAAKVKYSA